MNQPPPPSPLPQLIFYFIILLPFAILIYSIAKRKGRSVWLTLFGIVPGVNVFVAIWVASLPEAKLIREIEDLKSRLSGNQS
jgi:hypothetical protein